MSLAAGTRLGSYEIISPLGSGGMGEVYRARDTKLGRDVAIKVLPERLLRHPEYLSRFEREAQALAALSHPNVLAIFELGEDNGVTFVVTELLEGETLRSRLETGALPLKKAVDLIIQVVRGLAAAHEKALVHRDLKPENLFLTKDGGIKILDFGLAKVTHSEGELLADDFPTRARDTVPGTILGTVGYMSPEQVGGKAADARSDIFSVGVVLHEVLLGERAFSGDSAAETMSAILRDEPSGLAKAERELPPALARLLSRCLEKNPEERFQSARDLGFSLEAISDVEAPAAPRKLASEGAPSVAVLPFSDMSREKDQDYFCEGIAEEVINALHQVKGLRVASRTSAFQFKGRAKDIREIGAALNVGGFSREASAPRESGSGWSPNSPTSRMATSAGRSATTGRWRTSLRSRMRSRRVSPTPCEASSRAGSARIGKAGRRGTSKRTASI